VRGVFKVGDKVRVTGKPNLYPGSGKLTFICSKIEAAGEGKLYELFLRLKNELAALGCCFTSYSQFYSHFQQPEFEE